jgi:hypothetical protein
MQLLKFVELFVKLTIKGAQPIDLFDVKEAVGICANEKLCSIFIIINAA